MLPRSPKAAFWEIAPTRSSTPPMEKLQRPRTRGSGRSCSTFRAALTDYPKTGGKAPPVRITMPHCAIVNSEQPNHHQAHSKVLKRQVTLDATVYAHQEAGEST